MSSNSLNGDLSLQSSQTVYNAYQVLPKINIKKRPGEYFAKQQPITVFGTNPPKTLLTEWLVQSIFSFLDATSWSHSVLVNKAWYQAAKGKAFVLQIPQANQIQGQHDRYTLKQCITREEAQAILKQTGIEIPFKPGQEQVKDFTLGRGNFGEFCIGLAAKTHYVGIKITRGADATEKEAQIQQRLTGLPYIMPILDSCKRDTHGTAALYQVMELGGLGSTAKLKHYLTRIADQSFKEQVLFCLAEGLLIGLAKMHEAGFYHLDIKPDNLVVRQDGKVFIIDFGCSAYSPKELFDLSKENGDVRYFSPDRWLVKHQFHICSGAKVDAWAAGLTLLVIAQPKTDTIEDTEWMFWGMRNINAKAGSHMTKKEMNTLIGYAEAQLAQVSMLQDPPQDSVWSLIKGLLTTDWDKRLTVAQALRHPWFELMQKESHLWREETVAYLRELVQDSQREARVANAPAQQFGALSPQDLPFPHFTTFIKRNQLQSMLEKVLFSTDSYDKTSVIACYGMGGVGKTQMITHMLHTKKVQDHFGLKLWFRGADNKSFIETQMLILARELGLCDDKTPFEKALPKLHFYLGNYPKKFGKPWLAIYDNAEDAAMLGPYLPPSGGQVIVTTRSPNWPDALPVDVLTAEEGQTLVQKLLRKSDPLGKDLCQELGYLPLGIVQACAYIRNQQLTISDYLALLRKNAAMIEKDETLFGKRLPNSMLSLWQATFQVIQTSNPEAFQLLQTLAYLTPDSIPAHLMQKLASSKAKDLLKQYALLQENQEGSCSIHRLVQLTARSKQDPDKQSEALVKGMITLDEVYDFSPATVLIIQHNKQLLTHGESLLAHVDQRTSVSALLAPLANTLSWLGNLQGELAEPYKKKDLLEKALKLTQQIYGDEHTDVAQSLNNLGVAWEALGDSKKAIQYHEQSFAIWKKVYGDEHPDVATSLNNLGTAWKALGDAKKAIQYYEQSLAIKKKVYGDEHPDVATSLNNLGSAWEALGDAKKAIQYHEQSFAIWKKVYGDEHPDVATSLNNLGSAWEALGDAKKAIQYHEQALAIQKKVYGDEHPAVATSLKSLGFAWKALGDAKKAIQYYDQSLAIWKKVYGDEHCNVAFILNNLGSAWEYLGDAKRAIEYHEQALAIFKKVYGEEHSAVALTLNELGVAWKDLGGARKAIEYYVQALAIYKKVYGEEHPFVGRSLGNVGNCWNALGEAMNAIQYHEQALAIFKKVYGEKHPCVSTTLCNLGNAWKTSGEAMKAIEYHELALTIDKNVYGEEHPDVATDLNNLGETWLVLGDSKKAIEYYDRAFTIRKKVFGNVHPDVAESLNNFGEAWRALGEFKKALEYCEQALAIYKKIYGDEHPDVASSLNNLGSTWKALGDAKKEAEYFKLAYQMALKLPSMGKDHPRTKIYKSCLDKTTADSSEDRKK